MPPLIPSGGLLIFKKEREILYEQNDWKNNKKTNRRK